MQNVRLNKGIITKLNILKWQLNAFIYVTKLSRCQGGNKARDHATMKYMLLMF